jgi:hypothetical protein
MLVGVQNLDFRIAFEHSGRDFALLIGFERQRHALIGVHTDANLFYVQDDIGNIFVDTVNGGEFVKTALDTHRHDSRALNL